MHYTPTPHRFATVVVSAACACGGTDTGPRSTVFDSAGVRIAVNAVPAAGAASWHLEEPAELIIGDEVRQPLNQVGDVLVLEDRIVVASQRRELLFFALDGTLITRAGGAGSGPGEFQRLVRLWHLPGDTVAALNGHPPRLVRFDRDGTLLDDVALNLPGEPHRPARLADGSIVFGQSGWPSFPAGQTQPTLSAGRYRVVRHMPGTNALDTLFELPGSPSWGTGRAFVAVPFAPAPLVTAAGSHVYAASTATLDVGVYTPDGTLLRRVRRTHADRPLDRTTLRRWQAEQARLAPADQPRTEGGAAPLEPPLPDAAPAFEALLATGDWLWLQLYRLPGDAHREWLAFDADGRLHGVLHVPAELRVTHIDHDRVVGVWTDAMGVETVRSYRRRG